MRKKNSCDSFRGGLEVRTYYADPHLDPLLLPVYRGVGGGQRLLQQLALGLGRLAAVAA